MHKQRRAGHNTVACAQRCVCVGGHVCATGATKVHSKRAALGPGGWMPITDEMTRHSDRLTCAAGAAATSNPSSWTARSACQQRSARTSKRPTVRISHRGVLVLDSVCR